MLDSSSENAIGARRLIGATLLAFVFFLPLHQHFFTPTPQFAKDCSCVHGVKTAAGLGTAPASWTPSFQTSAVIDRESQVPFQLWGGCHSSRAPPLTQSL